MEEEDKAAEDQLATWETPTLTTFEVENAEAGGALGDDGTVLLS